MAFFDRLSRVTSNIHGYVEVRAVSGRIKQSAKQVDKPRKRLNFTATESKRLQYDLGEAVNLVSAIHVEAVKNSAERQEVAQLKAAALTELNNSLQGTKMTIGGIINADTALVNLKRKLEMAAQNSKSLRGALDHDEQQVPQQTPAPQPNHLQDPADPDSLTYTEQTPKRHKLDNLQPPPTSRRKRKARDKILTQESLDTGGSWTA